MITVYGGLVSITLKDLVTSFGAAVTPPCCWLRSLLILVDSFLVFTLARTLHFFMDLELSELICLSGFALRRGDNVCYKTLLLLLGVSFLFE
jgi:hypothetical protein